MARMGRPEGTNGFNSIKKAQQRSRPTPLAADPEDKGEILNKLSGSDSKSKKGLYVDGKKHNKLNKDSFLQLLSHQLQNQDPMKPMDQNKFAADLAQYSQLEQMQNMNTSLEAMKNSNPAQNKFYAASFLGKEVITGGSSFNYKGEGEMANLNMSLEENATQAIVYIMDKNSQTVRTMQVKDLNKGQNTIQWDGKRDDGQFEAPGVYTAMVKAVNEKYEPVKVHTKQTGKVIGVNFEDGDMLLSLEGGRKVFLRDVESFHSTPQKMQAPQNQRALMPVDQMMDLKVKNADAYRKEMEAKNVKDLYPGLKEY